MRSRGSALGAFILLLATTGTSGVPAADVAVTADTRTTASGDRIPYLLFAPPPGMESPAAPYPALILTHGFARDYGRHIDKAVRYAGDGLIVLTPNLLPPEAGPAAHLRNVANTVDHYRWLAARGADASDPLFGLLDPQRIALGGHSAGGAISLEAAWVLQRSGAAVAALVLLDATLYPQTERAAARLQALPLLSVRSEPDPCNASGAIADLPALLAFPITDLKVAGATHCDPEGPTDIACEVLCGASTQEAQAAYEVLVQDFLDDALGSAR